MTAPDPGGSTVTPAPLPRTTGRLRPTLMIMAVVGTALTLGSLARVAVVARDQLPAPFDLTYETPNLATILSITEGKNIYSSEVYETGNFVFTMYTPAFHYLIAALPASTANPFLTGRLVAMTFMVLAASLVFMPGRSGSSLASPGPRLGLLLLDPADRFEHVVLASRLDGPVPVRLDGRPRRRHPLRPQSCSPGGGPAVASPFSRNRPT